MAEVPPSAVVVLQPYGSIYFATSGGLEAKLPAVTVASRGSVVILRLRGVDEVGVTFLDVLGRYASALRRANCRLLLVTDSSRLLTQLRVTGVLEVVGAESVYRGDEWVGRALRRAYRDAQAWVREQAAGQH